VEKSVNSRTAGASRFQVDCFPFIFSLEELDILEKKGHILKALSEGKREPATREEKSFVQFAKGKTKAASTIEKAWFKYQNRRELEASLLETEEVYREYLRKFRA